MAKRLKSTSPPALPPQPPQILSVALPELTTMLIQKAGLHEGLYELVATFTVHIGNFAFEPNRQPMPGTAAALVALGISPSMPSSPLAVDAAIVNPAPPLVTRKPPTTRRR